MSDHNAEGDDWVRFRVAIVTANVREADFYFEEMRNYVTEHMDHCTFRAHQPAKVLIIWHAEHETCTELIFLPVTSTTSRTIRGAQFTTCRWVGSVGYGVSDVERATLDLVTERCGRWPPTVNGVRTPLPEHTKEFLDAVDTRKW